MFWRKAITASPCLRQNHRECQKPRISSSQYGSLLIQIIMSKLRSEIRIQIARNTTAEVWEIDHLLGVILKEVKAREISEDVQTETNNRKQDIRNQSTAANLFVRDETNESKLKCVYCGELHFSGSFGRVKDLKSRKNILN